MKKYLIHKKFISKHFSCLIDSIKDMKIKGFDMVGEWFTYNYRIQSKYIVIKIEDYGFF